MTLNGVITLASA